MDNFNWSLYNTDKDTVKGNRHNYGSIYDKHFSKIREKLKGIVVEIGSREGSINLWLDYFPNSQKIIGVDIKPFKINNNRFTFEKLNQLNEVHNRYLLQKYKDIRIVIDDGPHTSDAQLISLQTILPLLQKDSWFVIEDIHCTDLDDLYYEKNISDSDISVNNLIREWKSNIFKKYKYISNPEKIEKLDLDIFIEKGRISEIIFIHKK